MRRWGAAVAVAIAGSVVATSTGQAASKTSSTPKSGGEIIYGIANNIGGWCFANALNADSLGATRTVYESLVERDSRGRFIPHLAESWTPSPDFKVWTFKIRKGITFSNGEVFDANVARTNIQIGAGHVVPAASYAGTGIGVNANIMLVEAPDADTLRITLDKPDNQFIGLLYRAGRYVMRAPAQIASPTTCATRPIGTGPFMVESYVPDQTVVVRNPNYWRKDGKGRQLPYLDKITIKTVKEGSQRAAAVRKGALDAAYFQSGDATFVTDLMKRKSVVQEFKAGTNLWGQWMPNQNKAGSPFKFKNCRLAAAHSIDWRTYNRVRLRGLGNVNGSIVGDGHTLFSTKGSPRFSLKLAREALARCNTDLGAEAPMKITLYADQSTQSLNNVKTLQAMMEKAGIQFNPIIQQESNALIPQIYNRNGNAFDFAQGTPAEGPGPGYVVPFFMSNAFPADSKSPVTTLRVFGKVIALGNHSDTNVDNLVYAAMAETTKARQDAAWKKVTEYLQTEAIAIPAVHSGAWTFVNRKSNLKGFGTLRNPDGKTFAPSLDLKGQEWTGIWKG